MLINFNSYTSTEVLWGKKKKEENKKPLSTLLHLSFERQEKQLL